MLLQELQQDRIGLDNHVGEMDKNIHLLASGNATAKRLQQIPGIEYRSDLCDFSLKFP